MILQKSRTDFEKTCKTAREDAVAFQKYVLEEQKKGIDIISEVEEELLAEEKRIDKIKEDIKIEEENKKKAKLQERINSIMIYTHELDVIRIPNMSEDEFSKLVQNERMLFEEREEKRINEEQEAKVIEDKRIEDERIRIEKEEQERQTFLEEKRLFDIERQKIIDEKNKIEQEKATILFKQQQVERDRINKELAELREKEAIELQKKQKEQQDKDEQIKLEKKKKYNKFLLDNGWTEETKDNFHPVWSNDNKKVTLWKLVGVLDI